MSNINDLKQYNNIKFKYTQKKSRLSVLNVLLDKDNCDMVKASAIDAVECAYDEEDKLIEDIYNDKYDAQVRLKAPRSGHSSIVEDSVISRQEKENERDKLEIELAYLAF